MSSKKNNIQYVCKECGEKFSKWAGKCPECGAWSSFFEQEIKDNKSNRGISTASPTPMPISQVPTEQAKRLSTSNPEFDRTLGGGMAPGSLVLIGGDPGIGKSTLVLQTLSTIAAAGCKTLYVSGEESAAQVKLRAERLGAAGSDMLLLCETSLSKILEYAEQIKPQVMVIDSIQTIYSEELPGTPGSVSQLRECALKLMVYAKNSGSVTMLIGHVTKDGQIAGPRILEHIVDTVAYFEGDKKGQYRILRTVKNRFGATDEIGVFEMTSLGLIPVQNPSKIFLQDGELLPGSAVSCTIEGSRALLFEIQALVGKSSYAMPQRVSAGVEQKKLTIILALLERFAKIQTGSSDVFVSVAGGLKLDDPGIDLSLALAIVSNAVNANLPPRSIVIGELGLSGEVRSVSSLDLRIKEAQRLGFEKIAVPANGKIPAVKGIEIIKLSRLEQAVEWLLKYALVLCAFLFSCEANRLEVSEVFDNNAPKEAYEVSPSGEKKTFRSWHRNGIKAEEMPFANGVPNGAYRKWSITGFIIESGSYKDSLREGKWTFFAKEKVPYVQGSYKKGLKQGKWTIFDEKGKIAGEQFYKDDSAIGTWRKFHNGVLIEENSCHPLNQAGYFRSYSHEGKALLYQECRNGKLDGVFMSYYPGGSLHKVGHFKDGLKNGLWVEYFANGNLRKIENWAFAMRDGEWARFNETGEVLAKAEFMDGYGFFEDTSWRNNRVHGEIRIPFKEGEYFRIETYENGIKQRTEDYLKDSTRLALGFWRDGKKDGAWQTWYRSGVLKDSLNFKAGELFGEQFHYDSTGRLYKKENKFGKNMPNLVEVF